MKITVYVIALALGLGSCADHKTRSKVNNNMNNQDITAANIVETIAAQVKHYPQEPIYYLRIGKANCLIEILVNDLPVYKSYELANLATPLKINHNILKSGTQTITYKLYPVGDLIKEEYDYGETVTKLGNASRVSISVTQWDNKSEDSADEELVIKHLSPTKSDNDDVFAGTGLPYYEHSFTFEAQVPYELESWNNAADLTKLPKEQIENTMVQYYIKYNKAIEEKDANTIAQMEYNALKNDAIAYYFTEKRIREGWDETLEFFNYEVRDIKPVEDYELVFYGGGAIAFLRHKTIEDIRLRNQCAGWMLYRKTENSRMKVWFFGLYAMITKENFAKGNLKLEGF